MLERYKLGTLVLLFTGLILLAGCRSDKKETAGIKCQVHLTYKDQPLQMLTEYDLPDKGKIRFTRVSFFVAPMQLKVSGNTTSSGETQMLNFSSLTTEQAASDGLSIIYEDLPVGQATDVDWLFGVTAAENKKVPNDFPIDHALAANSEYWADWNSYIFSKIEGKADFDGDGQFEQSIVLHLGGDEGGANISQKNVNWDLDADKVRDIKATIDIHNVIFNQENPYDLRSQPIIHRLDQNDQVKHLATNLAQSIAFEDLGSH